MPAGARPAGGACGWLLYGSAACVVVCMWYASAMAEGKEAAARLRGRRAAANHGRARCLVSGRRIPPLLRGHKTKREAKGKKERKGGGEKPNARSARSNAAL